MTDTNPLTLISLWTNAYPFLRTIFFILIVFVACDFLISLLRRSLAMRAYTRRQRSNIEIFLRFIKYTVFLAAIIAVIFRYSGSLQQFGLVLGAITAALGFALQRPITAVAAWVMIIIKRPFDIGDRIIIGDVKGNVIDISLTHISLEEVGRYGGEEVSGRVVVIPNSVLFEKSITNYSLQNDYVLGQVITTISFQSNLEEALRIMIQAAKKFTDEYSAVVSKDPHTRLYFSSNGMEIHVRYYVPFGKAQEVATSITGEIYNLIKQASDIEISYPHMKIFLEKERNLF